MKVHIHTEYAFQLMESLVSLRDNIGDIPEAFTTSKEVNDLPRPKGVGFDLNKFLTVFDKIHLRKGTVLDYAYYFYDIGGGPLIYTRKESEPSLSANEYQRKFKRTQNEPFLKDLLIDNDPESFFQVTVLYRVIDQFYLFWHALYNDHRFVFSKDSAERILEGLREMDKGETKKRLNHISFAPLVKKNGGRAEVRCVMFSNWTGFYQSHSDISWPNLSMATRTEVIIPYNRGICF